MFSHDLVEEPDLHRQEYMLSKYVQRLPLSGELIKQFLQWPFIPFVMLHSSFSMLLNFKGTCGRVQTSSQKKQFLPDYERVSGAHVFPPWLHTVDLSAPGHGSPFPASCPLHARLPPAQATLNLQPNNRAAEINRTAGSV